MNKKFTDADIENDPIFQKFVNKKKGRKKGTIRNYKLALKLFSNFTGKSPEEIHDIHKRDLKNRTPEFEMELTDYLDDYVSYLIEDRNQSFDTIKSNVSRVLGFLHAFRLRPTPEVEISKQRVAEDAKYALKLEDIQKAITHATPTYKVVFITQAQTGLSISDACLLDVEDFIFAVSERGENLVIQEDLTLKEAIKRVKNNPDIIGCFDLRRKKTNNEFYTFAGPEVLKNIATLLESRDDYLNVPKAPVFMKEISHLKKEKQKDITLEDMRLTPEMTKNFIDRLHEPKQIFPKIYVDEKRRNFFRSHKLRKWFSNQVRFKAGFDSDDTKYLMGQKTGDVLEHYIDPNNYTALKANYRKALPFLAINDEIVMEENLEIIEQLQKESEIKDEKIDRLEKKMEETQKKSDEKIGKLEAMVTAFINQKNKKE